MALECVRWVTIAAMVLTFIVVATWLSMDD